MTNPDSLANLPLEAQRTIDRICTTFDAGWQESSGSTLKSWLDQAAPELRSTLLRELLRVDFEHLAAAGIEIDAARYRSQLEADQAAIVDEVRSQFSGQSSSVTETLRATEAISDSRSSEARSANSFAYEFIPGQLLGRFRIVKGLGRGSFGEVYRALDTDLEREVAIKVQRREWLASPDEQQRFAREARAAAAVQHPHLCPIYELARIDGRQCIVMSLIEGPTLDQRLQEVGRYPPYAATQLLSKVISGVQAAHAGGLIHRDLKPGNILFDSRGEPIVTDFGLALRPLSNDPRLTGSGTIVGSAAYMSPEQARGRGSSAGPGADIYSLGAMLYELLTGRPPFTGSVAEVLASHLHEEPLPPSRFERHIPPALDIICLRAMAKDPSRRYATAKELNDAIAEWQLTSSQYEPEEKPAANVHVTPRRNRAPLVVLALLLAGLILGGVIYVVTDQGELRIEALDDDVQVVVLQGGKEVKVIDLKTNSEVRLHRGDYELKIKGNQNELRVEPAGVTVLRGKTAIASIKKVEQKPTPPPDSPLVADAADRKVAEWLKKNSLVFHWRKRNSTEVFSSEGELPAEPIFITGFDSFSSPAINDATLEQFGDLRGIEALRIGGEGITDKSAAVIEKLVSLHDIGLYSPKVTDKTCDALAKLPKLHSILIAESSITDKGLSRFLPNDRLTGMHVPTGGNNAAGLKLLAGCPSLTSLRFLGPSVTNDLLKDIKKLPRLETLHLVEPSVTAEGWEILATTQIYCIWLVSPQYTLSDADLKGLAKIPNLLELQFEVDANFTSLAGLAGCSNLHTLHLHSMKLRAAQLAGLDEIPSLTYLVLASPELNDDAASVLKKLSRLKILKIHDTQISKEKYLELKAALPQCSILSAHAP